MVIQQSNELRRDIDRHLGRPMNDGEWQMLDTQGYIRRFERSAMGSDGLAAVINQWREAVGNSETVAVSRHRTGISEQRSAAIEEIVAQEAARDAGVVSFRKS